MSNISFKHLYFEGGVVYRYEPVAYCLQIIEAALVNGETVIVEYFDDSQTIFNSAPKEED